YNVLRFAPDNNQSMSRMLRLTTLKMFELIVNEYLQQTVYKDWSIISLLQYIKSKSVLSADMIETLKTEIYLVLRSFSDPININLHENAKKRTWKVLSKFDKSFSTTVVKSFIEELKLEDERRAYLTTLSRKITSINALQLLEEQRMAKKLIEDMHNKDVKDSTSAIDDHTKWKHDELQLLEKLIEDMRNKDVRGSTSAIDNHTKQRSDESHSLDNDEMLAKRARVEIESQNTTIYENDEISPLVNIKTLTSPVESEEIKNRDRGSY
ncbi:9732_t:CDS:2, partial [Funneliformis caledonium]